MRKPWSAKEFASRSRPHSKSTRLLLGKDSSLSSLKMRTLVNFDSQKSLMRPITAVTTGSLWATARTFQQSQDIEVEGLTSEQVRRIYKAKCIDLDILHIKDQEQRFFNFCSKSFTNRTIGLNENGLGSESMQVLSKILKNNFNFCRLNLSKNNIGERGIMQLANLLKNHQSLVAVDISSNDIAVDGLSKFFYTLKENMTLVSINVCSLEGLHRNRLGCKGAEAVSEFLRYNRVLTHLNIGDTGIGKEGFEYIIQGIAHNDVLVFLDISNNGLGYAGIEGFCQSLLTTKLRELNLAGNRIGNKACEYLAKTLAHKSQVHCPLEKLDLSACDITAYGISKICEALENNPHVTHLVVDNNNLAQYSGAALGKCFTLNSALALVSLSNCSLKDENMPKICEGMARNIKINKLNLSKNGISDSSAGFLAEVLKKNSHLVALDLSYNLIKNKGGLEIVTALKYNSTIENINFTENSLKDEAGRVLAEITRFKPNLLKIDLTMNPMNLKYVKEIKENLNRNNFNYKQLLSPKLKREIEKQKQAIGQGGIEQVFMRIDDKKKEKRDYYEKIEKLQQKLSVTKSEEGEKNSAVSHELLETKDKSQVLSVEIENFQIEFFKARIALEKQQNEASDSIAFTQQDIQKLDKKSN